MRNLNLLIPLKRFSSKQGKLLLKKVKKEILFI